MDWLVDCLSSCRHYKALEDNSEFPPNLKSLVELMRSLPMFKLLTKLTGLNLTDLESEESLQENPATSTREMGNGNESNASCTFEIRHWSHGSYTLMHDSDPGMQEFALDAMLFFGCDGEKLEPKVSFKTDVFIKLPVLDQIKRKDTCIAPYLQLLDMYVCIQHPKRAASTPQPTISIASQPPQFISSYSQITCDRLLQIEGRPAPRPSPACWDILGYIMPHLVTNVCGPPSSV